jgi:hypothetical protein
MKCILFLFICLVVHSESSAQTGGAIPLNYSSPPASDLVYQGEPISPTEAFELSQQGFDLSKLDPSEDQDVWKNRFQTNDRIETPIFPDQEVTFKDFVLSQTGKLRFLAKDASGETLDFITSKYVLSQLFGRNLLVMLGYVVPEISFVPRL